MRLIDADKLKQSLPKTAIMQAVTDLIDAQATVADTEQYVPMIRIRDNDFDPPRDRYVGDDPRHDWLEIDENGSLAYRNFQCGECTPYGYSFLPTFVAESEYEDRDGRYITCRRAYILESEWKEHDSQDE